ncbi:ligase-associated DNA damage response endonuclease PdeM [Caldimonas brevitalea]|uniref:DEAD/DEAH box helicase n=1 Tax=Caldimonas brevitalea TaxID=413882 RepID=A0A0G3BPG2_9BURK|nr:ligase-associated DNA damage response endonuclease PdeM [Caldimonas brevitalea]AKJ31309.1 DEAD/DEAH box helicase [Caldimonas brevitalea]
MLTTQLQGEPLTLLPEKAAYLAAHQTLLVADAHIGKAVSFRRWGVPVPRGTTAETLAVLDTLLQRTACRRVVFLGDFLHSARAHAPGTLGALQRWRDAHPDLDLVLVRGNHDDRAGDPPAALRIRCVDEPYRLGPFALCHHPQQVANAYVLAGHLHPCFNLSGRALDRLRLPCFWLGPAVGVLPAFGAFTGMHRITPAGGDRLFVTADGRVMEVPRG